MCLCVVTLISQWAISVYGATGPSLMLDSNTQSSLSVWRVFGSQRPTEMVPTTLRGPPVWPVSSTFPSASPSPGFLIGGSVEFPNLSFSLDLADSASPQFHLQAQALSQYVSRNDLPGQWPPGHLPSRSWPVVQRCLRRMLCRSRCMLGRLAHGLPPHSSARKIKSTTWEMKSTLSSTRLSQYSSSRIVVLVK